MRLNDCNCNDICVEIFVLELAEALHKVAYRDTLGQSLYMRQEKVGSFTPQSVSAEMRILEKFVTL